MQTNHELIVTGRHRALVLFFPFSHVLLHPVPPSEKMVVVHARYKRCVSAAYSIYMVVVSPGAVPDPAAAVLVREAAVPDPAAAVPSSCPMA